MAAFTGNSIENNILGAMRFREGRSWRVTSRATLARGCFTNFQDFREVRGTRGCQRGVGAQVVIKFAPGGVLIALFCCAAMAGGGRATLRAVEVGRTNFVGFRASNS